MTNVEIVRAWKDEDYRLSLSDAQRASLAANPVGMVDLSDLELESAAGGCCNGGTQWDCSIAGCLTCTAYPCRSVGEATC
jgi:mersacidin/lichenicidin family type 2 lantibiotic